MSYRIYRVPRVVSCLLLSALALPAFPDSASSPSSGVLLRPVTALPEAEQAAHRGRLSTLGVKPQHAFVDLRTGSWATLLLSRPILAEAWSPPPQTAALGSGERAALRTGAWDAIHRFLRQHREALGLDPEELAGGDVAVHGTGEVIQIHAPRVFRGLPVRGSYLSAVINRGNLVLLGARRWGPVEVSLEPGVSPDQAIAALDADVVGSIGPAPRLALLPGPQEGPEGPSYGHRLVWQILSDSGYEALVDAHHREVLSLQHRSRSADAASVVGGVYPTSNDGQGQEGMEQLLWPMPNALVRDQATGEDHRTDAGGNLPACLDGPFTVLGFSTLPLTFQDDCGAVNETFPGPVIDLSGGPGTDCDLPPGQPAGTSHAARTAAYELDRMFGTFRGQLPGSSFLRNRRGVSLVTRRTWVNINDLGSFDPDLIGCYYLQENRDTDAIICPKSTASRANPGEIASILDHEMGHLIDANDLTLELSSPSEGIADAYSALRQNQTCIGRGLNAGQCGGYGDPCTDCTGVRDIDWAAHTSGAPHDIAFIDAACAPGPRENGPCGGNAHCEGMVVAEAIWDLYRRDLQAAPYNLLPATALELATRLTYLGAGGVGDWFQCADGAGTGDGCNADSGYLNFLAIDDDNGDLTDGTPHMTAIFNAFDRHGIACAVPAVQDSGCAGTPTARPVVQATGRNREVHLSWPPVAGATSYEVFRTEGVARCAFGKIKIAELTDTEFLDTGLLNGREYSYVVIPKGPGLSCFGVNSTCTSVTPVDAPKLEVVAESPALTMETGDGDRFLDNCETAEVAFGLLNSGLGTLTNVRIVAASSPSHPQLEGLATLPIAVTPNLLPCASADAAFPFRARGLGHDETLELLFEVTADELFPTSLLVELAFGDVESDFEARAHHTFSFEADLEGWESREGDFRRVAGPGGNGSGAFIEALPFGRQRCDQLVSPLLRLSASSTLSLWNNFDMTLPNTFDGYIFETANVQVRRLEGGLGSRPRQVDSGRPYFDPKDIGPEEWWICNHYTNGWTGLGDSWATSAFGAATLQAPDLAGEPVLLDVVYGQSRRNQKPGFAFDEVTLTDFDLQVPDTQGNQLCPGPIFVDGFESGDTSAWAAATP